MTTSQSLLILYIGVNLCIHKLSHRDILEISFNNSIVTVVTYTAQLVPKIKMNETYNSQEPNNAMFYNNNSTPSNDAQSQNNNNSTGNSSVVNAAASMHANNGNHNNDNINTNDSINENNNNNNGNNNSNSSGNTNNNNKNKGKNKTIVGIATITRSMSYMDSYIICKASLLIIKTLSSIN